MYLTKLVEADPATGQVTGHPCFGCPARDAALCDALTLPERVAFRQLGNRKLLSPDDTLCWQGDHAAYVYTVTKGVLRLSRMLTDGRRQIAGFAFPGAFIGVTLEDEHSFTVEAVTRAELCQCSRTRFDAFVERHPSMQQRLYSAAAGELAAAREQLVLLGCKTAVERLASFLLDMARHTPQPASGAICAALPMSRRDIADYLGLRVETISRELSALKAHRVIRMTGVHMLEIVDRDTLDRLAAS
ncbi:MAG: hypothetical protein CVT83_02815 [Alphaproteobacteria bacterium HGW-Alphaproteobacteria-5]|jgi:CRP/FNR family transcriptional regulator|nr:MAG: hypothetical protein CVT83_02815 [Alphaproteobacteria bacterium HGW-Alphaproteobacteria-5]